MALPQDFLTQLVAEVADLKEIKDAQKNVKETDSKVALCARVAYTQVMKFTKVPWHKSERTVYFDAYTAPLTLPIYPLHQPPVPQTDPATNVITVIANGEEVDDADWEYKKGQMVLFEDELDDPMNERYCDIEITGTMGLETCQESETIYTAMLMQTIGNYHRRDSLGLAETSGERGTSRRPADDGQILDSVAQILQDAVYQGSGYFVGVV